MTFLHNWKTTSCESKPFSHVWEGFCKSKCFHVQFLLPNLLQCNSRANLIAASDSLAVAPHCASLVLTKLHSIVGFSDFMESRRVIKAKTVKEDPQPQYEVFVLGVGGFLSLMFFARACYGVSGVGSGYMKRSKKPSAKWGGRLRVLPALWGCCPSPRTEPHSRPAGGDTQTTQKVR